MNNLRIEWRLHRTVGAHLGSANDQGNDGHNAGAIVAYDAETLQPLWSSAGALPPSIPPTGSLSGLGKFVPPMIANGKVFVVTSSGLEIYSAP